MPRFSYNPEEEPKTQAQTVSRSEGVEAASAYYQEHRPKRHTGRIVAIVIFSIIAVLGIAGGIVGMRLMNSAQEVKAEAREVMDELNGLQDAIKSTEPERLQQISSNVSVKAHNIKDEVNTSLWNFATVIPVYGQDVKSAQALADVLVDLSDNALVPLASNADIMNLNHIFSDSTINVEAVRSLASAVDQAAPVLSRSADKLEALPPAHLSQVSEMLDKAKDKIIMADDLVAKAQTILPYLPGILGAEGQRDYLVLAQGNAEIRPAGGFPGAVGLLTIADGHISMGDFMSGGEWQSDANERDSQSAASDEEKYAFGGSMGGDALFCTYTPAFDRVGPIAASMWNQTYDLHINGVIGVDPIFLQTMLGLAGGVTTSEGTVVDGSNAAQMLLNQVYWDYGYYGQWGNDMEDAFFVEVANLAAHQLFNNIGSVGIKDLYQTLIDSAKDYRLQVWLENENEQKLMEDLGFSGKMPNDPKKPVIGTFAADNTWSKIDWYLKLDTTLSEPHDNGDGTKTYNCTTILTNTLDEYTASIAPEYITGGNPNERTKGDMITTMFFFAPAGGSIANVGCDYNDYPSDFTFSASWSDDFIGEVYGFQYWLRAVRTAPGTSTTFTYDITVPSDAEEPTIRTSPMPRVIE